MPRDYDSDFDDTPPPSPKRGPPPSFGRSVLFRLRRHRVLVLVVGAALVAWYFLTRRHHGPWIKPTHQPSLNYKNVDWRQYAYAQYAADGQELCAAVMVFDDLARYGSRARRILVYPDDMDLEVLGSRDRDSQLLLEARDTYGALLIPISKLRLEDEADEERRARKQGAAAMGAIFSQTQFSRVIYMDPAVTLFKHMDDLFLLPSATMAMPRAYWKLPGTQGLTPSFLVVEPAELEARRMIEEDDVDLLYGDSAMVLPHRPYALISAEFRADNHSGYLGNDYEEWDPDRALREASLVHFADEPLPKPWIMWPHQALQDMRPSCEERVKTGKNRDSCREREIWVELYDGYRRRRKDICGLLSVPAPEWPPKNRTT